MNYKVKYARHHASMEQEFERLEEALGFAYYTNEYEEGYVKEIIDGNGVVVLEGDSLLIFYEECNDFFDEYKDNGKLTPSQHLNKNSRIMMEVLEKGLKEQEGAE